MRSKLWRALRRNALGVRFRRQHPIGPYIADFACYPLKLVVELDGPTHDGEEAQEHDGKRDAYLMRNGWSVFRFSNMDVYENLEGVVQALLGWVRDLTDELERRERPPARLRSVDG